MLKTGGMYGYMAVLYFLCVCVCLCVGCPSGFGLFADWLLSRGGGDSFGAAANREGGREGVPVVTDAG